MLAEMYMINYCYFCTFLKQLVSTQDERSFDSSSLKAFLKKTQVGYFVCMPCS